MGAEFEPWDDQETRSLIERFEGMLGFRGQYFFDVDDFEDIIDFYLERNNLSKARQAINLAMSQHPLNVSFLIRKAHFLLASDKSEEALLVLDEAEILDPLNIDILFSRAALFSKLKRYPEAIEQYLQALPEAEEKDEVYAYIAFEYENLANYAMALDYLKKGVALNPENFSSLYEISFCYEVVQKLDEGIQWFTDFLDKQPYSKVAWFCLGVLHSTSGEYENAINAYDFVIAIDESYSSAYFNKANAFANLKNYEKALELYKETMNFEEPEVTTFFYIGECYQELEDYDNALLYFEKARDMDEFFAESYIGMSEVFEARGEIERAIDCLKKAIDLYPENPDFWEQLADLLSDQKRYAEALAALEEAAKIDPLALGLRDHQAWIYADMGDLQTAEERLIAAMEESPDDFMLKYHLASVVWTSGRIPEALLILENPLTLSFETYEQLYDFFPDLRDNQDLTAFIGNYRKSAI
ncbi:MAG: tetratricopeptide repeat protein [Bacteroidota bacterium]